MLSSRARRTDEEKQHLDECMDVDGGTQIAARKLKPRPYQPGGDERPVAHPHCPDLRGEICKSPCIPINPRGTTAVASKKIDRPLVAGRTRRQDILAGKVLCFPAKATRTEGERGDRKTGGREDNGKGTASSGYSSITRRGDGDSRPRTSLPIRFRKNKGVTRK